MLRIRGDSVRLIEPEEWQAPAVRALQQEADRDGAQRLRPVSAVGLQVRAHAAPAAVLARGVSRPLRLDVRYVVALRNPLSVARSRAALDPQRGTQEQSDLEWLVNVVPYFRELRERPFVVVDYDLVLEHPARQLERIARCSDLPENRTTRSGDPRLRRRVPAARHAPYRLHRSRPGRDGRVNPLTRDAYLWLRRLATDECSVD